MWETYKQKTSFPASLLRTSTPKTLSNPQKEHEKSKQPEEAPEDPLKNQKELKNTF